MGSCITPIKNPEAQAKQLLAQIFDQAKQSCIPFQKFYALQKDKGKVKKFISNLDNNLFRLKQILDQILQKSTLSPQKNTIAVLLVLTKEITLFFQKIDSKLINNQINLFQNFFDQAWSKISRIEQFKEERFKLIDQFSEIKLPMRQILLSHKLIKYLLQAQTINFNTVNRLIQRRKSSFDPYIQNQELRLVLQKGLFQVSLLWFSRFFRNQSSLAMETMESVCRGRGQDLRTLILSLIKQNNNIGKDPKNQRQVLMFLIQNSQYPKRGVGLLSQLLPLFHFAEAVHPCKKKIIECYVTNKNRWSKDQPDMKSATELLFENLKLAFLRTEHTKDLVQLFLPYVESQTYIDDLLSILPNCRTLLPESQDKLLQFFLKFPESRVRILQFFRRTQTYSPKFLKTLLDFLKNPISSKFHILKRQMQVLEESTLLISAMFQELRDYVLVFWEFLHQLVAKVDSDSQISILYLIHCLQRGLVALVAPTQTQQKSSAFKALLRELSVDRQVSWQSNEIQRLTRIVYIQQNRQQLRFEISQQTRILKLRELGVQIDNQSFQDFDPHQSVSVIAGGESMQGIQVTNSIMNFNF